MRITRLFSISLVAALAASPAWAAILDARFSGTVVSQAGTGFAVGGPISGEFIYSTDSNSYVGFTIGGLSVAPGYGSTAALTADHYTALYRAQLSPVQQGGTLNSSFVVDLEALNPFPITSAIALLTNASLLATDLDLATNPNSFSPSTFGFVTANSNGSNSRNVTADLTSFQVSVPEPASLGLLAAACLGIAFRRRRV